MQWEGGLSEAPGGIGVKRGWGNHRAARQGRLEVLGGPRDHGKKRIQLTTCLNYHAINLGYIPQGKLRAVIPEAVS